MSYLRRNYDSLIGDRPRSEQSDGMVPRLSDVASLDILFCFDTTGSMYRFLERVRGEIAYLSGMIRDCIPRSRVGVLAYGDYCDARTTYVTRGLGFTSDINKMERFIRTIQKTDGGDFPEAVEEALFAANGMGWRLGSQRAIALIGDAPPHGVIDSVKNCKYGHFWRREVEALRCKGIKVYAIQCGRHRDTERVFRAMASITGGVYLNLGNINDLVDLLLGICMGEVGLLVAFQERLRRSQQLTTSKKSLLNCLGSGSGEGLLP